MAHTTDDLFSDAVRQLLTAQCTPQVVRSIEAGQSAQPMWQLIEASGFADALVDETQGGAGLSLSAVYPVLELCGAFALPVPLAETMVARALLAQAGVDVPRGSITLSRGSAKPDGGVICRMVHGGCVGDWVLVTRQQGLEPGMAQGMAQDEVQVLGVAHGAAHGEASAPAMGVQDRAAPSTMTLLLPTSKATKSAAGFCLDAKLEWSQAVVAKALRFPCQYDVKELQASLYAAQLAGAMQAVFSRTLQYANDRNQFGRPIGKFQAIQHQLSVMAENAFAARMAAQMGCRSRTFMPDRLCVAVAKARTSEAAVEVAALSHSIHGAIGFTQEFDLQLYTRRLHLWRQAGGSESYWHAVLGEALVDQHQGLALDLIRSATDIV